MRHFYLVNFVAMMLSVDMMLFFFETRRHDALVLFFRCTILLQAENRVSEAVVRLVVEEAGGPYFQR